MELVYAKLQRGVMRRVGTKKQVILEDGTAQDPILPKWSDPKTLHKVKSWAELEEEQSPVAIHCGLSNIIVLDFDNDLFNEALALNNSLDDRFRCTNICKSVGKEGGHFVYAYEPNQLTEFINNPNGCKLHQLDTLYGNTLVYGTTSKNETKKVVVQQDYLIPMPLAMQLLAINRYQEKKYKTIISKEATSYSSSKLGAIAQRALTDVESFKQLLSIITPVRFKSLMAHSNKDLYELHPDRLPDGNGYNYLLAISGVFMKDPSIDKELHRQLLWYINNQFSTPLVERRLLNIYNRDIESSEYVYNPDWKTETYTLVAKNKHTLEVYAYYRGGNITYLVLDATTGESKVFKVVSALVDYLYIAAGKKITKDSILASIIEVDLIERPDQPYGKVGPHTFNAYKQCKEQEIFYNPAKYREEWDDKELNMPYNDQHPRWPKVTLGALNNACGSRTNMFLSFMARKYRTRQHSPLFFVFYGVPHSFKSAIVNGVFAKLSHDRHATISIDMLNDKFNAWQVNKDLVLLDEVHYVTSKDLKQMIQNINSISGNSTINGVRRMFEDVDTRSYPQELTFILTTNEVLMLTNEVNERRMVVFSTTTRVADALNMDNLAIQNAIKDESADFAYYLATQVADLEDESYLRNESWKTASYHKFIEEGQYLEDRMAKALDSDDIKKLMDCYIEAGGSKDKFHKCFYENSRGKVVLRLHNSRRDLASGDALLDGMDDLIQYKRLSRKLDLMDSKVKKMNDTRDGVYIGNKVTNYYCDSAVAKSLTRLSTRLVNPTLEELFELWEIK